MRHLAELHGGTFAAASAGLGQGAQFTLRLPVASALTTSQRNLVFEPTEKVSEVPTPLAAPDLAGLRVLLVDDEPDTLEILRVMLHQFGANVRGAASTSDALETFLKWKPDVLVSDLGMPGEDGFALIGKVRALTPEQGRDIPAAALTAHVRDEDRALALAAGYQTHIKKPVDPNKLAAAVASLSKKQQR